MSLFLNKNHYMKDYELSFKDKILNMSWSFFLFISLVVCIGLMLLYSITGGFDSLTERQLLHFGIGCLAFFIIAFSDLKLWMKYAYVIYILTLGMLIYVYVSGAFHMGAQRWIDLKFIQVQPSEMMKIALVLALARYFHASDEDDVKRTTHLIIPTLLMLVPVGLIVLQPDLGTALMLVFVTAAIFWIVGVQRWKFIAVACAGLAAIPVVWHFLHDYQRNRVLTFLNPEKDPLGVGYHILQSKITLGSGGVFGKGFLQGTQSHLNFIPEKHTDFIFTVLAEEFGLVGCSFLLVLYMIIIAYGFHMSLKSANFFGKLLGLGLTVNFATYVFINISMVMGIMPVVGIPLPLVSYGGTAMLVLMAGFGFIECVHVNEELEIGRTGVHDD